MHAVYLCIDIDIVSVDDGIYFVKDIVLLKKKITLLHKYFRYLHHTSTFVLAMVSTIKKTNLNSLALLLTDLAYLTVILFHLLVCIASSADQWKNRKT